MMGLAGTSHVELFFDSVRLGPEHLLGQEGRGLNHAFETLGRIRLAQIGARAVGKATRILDLMTEYARERRQFGKPIGERNSCSRAADEHEIKRGAPVFCSGSRSDRGSCAERISMVKVLRPDARAVADRACRSWAWANARLPSSDSFRDARIFRISTALGIHRTVTRSMLRHGAARFADII